MEVKKIAVIGSGTMGRGIAYTAALSGFDVALQDISEEALGRQKIIMVHWLLQVRKKDISQLTNGILSNKTSITQRN